jgi:hypothetical protein
LQVIKRMRNFISLNRAVLENDATFGNVRLLTNDRDISNQIHFDHTSKQCHNPSLGLVTKARAYKGVGQEQRPRVKPKSYTSCSRECRRMWGMNPHTLK